MKRCGLRLSRIAVSRAVIMRQHPHQPGFILKYETFALVMSGIYTVLHFSSAEDPVSVDTGSLEEQNQEPLETTWLQTSLLDLLFWVTANASLIDQAYIIWPLPGENRKRRALMTL